MFNPTTYHFFQKVLRLIFRAFFRLKVEGRANIPDAGGCILIANHPTWLDPPLIATVCPRTIHIVAMEFLFHLPVIHLFLRGLGCIPVKDDPATGRPTADISSFRAMARILKSGGILLIYPEGGRSDHGKVGDFASGPVALANAAKVPIIPIAICGACEAWPRGRVIPRPHPITVRFGAPVRLRGGRHRSDLNEGTDHLRNEIIKMMEVAP